MDNERIAALIERVEAAEGPDRELDADSARAFGWEGVMCTRINGDSIGYPPPGDRQQPVPAYTASIDAALTLLPEGWLWAAAGATPSDKARVGLQRKNPYAAAEGKAATPALALVAACLRTLLERERDG